MPQSECYVFKEFDQYPAGTVPRPARPGALPPGVSIGTLTRPAFDALGAAWFPL